MLDNDLLEQLVTFADLGTVSATAKKLLVSQPSITRGLQKLEEELGVKLFDRQANKLSLTKTGTLAVQEARSLLQAQADFIKNLQAFDQKQNKIKITSVAPGPLLLLSERYSQPNQLSLPEEEDF
ncbi:LysR family transcriptional regulator, partial [Streptococcus sobrinus]